MDCTPEQSLTSRLLQRLWLFPSPFSYLNSSRCEPQQVVLEEALGFDTYFTSGAVSSTGKASNFFRLVRVLFSEQIKVLFVTSLGAMIIIMSGDKVPNSALSKSPHNRNFTEGWHWHEENAVTRALEISQSLMSITDGCSNVIFSNYHQSLGKLNTIACVQPCWP